MRSDRLAIGAHASRAGSRVFLSVVLALCAHAFFWATQIFVCSLNITDRR